MINITEYPILTKKQVLPQVILVLVHSLKHNIVNRCIKIRGQPEANPFPSKPRFWARLRPNILFDFKISAWP